MRHFFLIVFNTFYHGKKLEIKFLQNINAANNACDVSSHTKSLRLLVLEIAQSVEQTFIC